MSDHLRTGFQVKLVDTSRRIIAGYAAVHSNLDKVGDIIDPSASVKAVARLSSYQDVDVFIGHQVQALPVGVPVKIQADSRGLYTETYVFEGPDGDNLLAVAKGLQQHGRTLGMSIGYRPNDSRPERRNGKLVRRLMDYDLREYSFASSKIIANPDALVVAVKTMIGDQMTYELKVIDGKHCIVKTDDDTVIGSYTTAPEALRSLAALYETGVATKAMSNDDAMQRMDDGDQKAEWDTAFMNNLPNSAFMYVEPGDDDADGKRVPRSKRHFPIRDMSGNVDAAHLRNALARIDGADVPGLDPGAKKNLQARARRMLEQVSGGKTVSTEPDEWKTGAPIMLHAAAYQLLDIAGIIVADAQAWKTLGQDVKSYERVRPEIRYKVEDVIDRIKDVLARAEYVDQGVDGAAQNDVLRAQLELLGV